MTDPDGVDLLHPATATVWLSPTVDHDEDHDEDHGEDESRKKKDPQQTATTTSSSGTDRRPIGSGTHGSISSSSSSSSTPLPFLVSPHGSASFLAGLRLSETHGAALGAAAAGGGTGPGFIGSGMVYYALAYAQVTVTIV